MDNQTATGEIRGVEILEDTSKVRELESEIDRLRALVARAVGILEAWPVYDDWEDAIDEAVAILRQPLPPAPSQAQEGRG